MLKPIIKKVFLKLGLLNTNQQKNVLIPINDMYDAETIEIIKNLGSEANCIDIGAHKGDILIEIIKYCPKGRHFAFEPIPDLYEHLKKLYNDKVSVFPFALSDENGSTSFNYVTSNPAYSGILKRKYDREHETDTSILIEKRKLDDVIPEDIPINFIKIDVEGGEFQVLKGAENVLKKYKPIIVFEQGLGGADVYGTDPREFYLFLTKLGYNISLMQYYLRKLDPLSIEEYCHQFHKRYNYYFVAYPVKSDEKPLR